MTPPSAYDAATFPSCAWGGKLFLQIHLLADLDPLADEGIGRRRVLLRRAGNGLVAAVAELPGGLGVAHHRGHGVAQGAADLDRRAWRGMQAPDAGDVDAVQPAFLEGWHIGHGGGAPRAGGGGWPPP